MTGRRTLALAVAAAVLAAALASPAAGQDASPCGGVEVSGNDRVVAGVLPATGEVVTGTAALYPDTRLRLFVCAADGEKTFDYQQNPGLAQVGDRADRFQVTVRVTDERAGERLAVGGDWLANANDPAPLRVRVPAGPSVTSNVTDAGPLSFADPATAREYRATEERFRRNLSAVSGGVSDLEAMAAAARAGGLDPAAANNSTVAAPVRALDRARSLRVGPTPSGQPGLEDLLYRAAWRADDGDRHLDQMAALADEERTARDELRGALDDYEDALRDRRGAAVGSALTDLGVGLAGGLVVGLAVGVLLVRRKASGESYDRQFTRDAGLDAGDLVVPVVAAALVLLAAELAVHLLFGLPDLFGAIL